MAGRRAPQTSAESQHYIDTGERPAGRVVEWRTAMQYTLRDLPQDVWDGAQQRAQREGWELPGVVRRLLEDYAAGRIAPSGTPPADPVAEKYRPIFGAAFDRLAAAADWPTLTDRERGQRLRQQMLDEDAAHHRPPRFASDFDFTLIAKRLGSRK